MSKKTLIAAAAGSAFAAGMAAAPIASAAENPFALTGLASGYQVAQAGKMPAGKCGQGMCGGMKAPAAEAKCGAAVLDTNKDGSLDKTEMGKMMQGKCGSVK